MASTVHAPTAVHVHCRFDGYWVVCTPEGSPLSVHEDARTATDAALARAADLGGAEVVVNDPRRGRRRLHAHGRFTR